MRGGTSFGIARQVARQSAHWLLVAALVCAGPRASGQKPSAKAPGAASVAPNDAIPVPHPELDGLEAAVAEQLTELRQTFESYARSPASTDTQLAEAYGALGEQYHAYALHGAAIACYANARALAREGSAWAHLQACVEVDAGRLDRAALAFEAAWRAQPRSATAIRLASVYAELNRGAEATELFGIALELEPGSAAARNGLGELALADGRHDDAARLFEEVLAILPAADRVHYSLAMAYRGLGDLERAREQLALRGTIGPRPKDSLLERVRERLRGEVAHGLRGRMAFAAGSDSEAAEAFGKAVEAAPESATARVNYAAALARLGQLDAAQQQLRAALSSDPDRPTVHFNLGLLLRVDAPQEALEHFEAALASRPSDAGARREVAILQRRLGRREEARAHLAVLLQDSLADEQAVLEQASLLVEEADYAAATELLERAQRDFPTRGLTAHALARLLAASPKLSLRDGERALVLARQVYAGAPTIGHGTTVALALGELGRCEEARAWQQEMHDRAVAEGRRDLIGVLSEALARYAAEAPCRPPSAP